MVAVVWQQRNPAKVQVVREGGRGGGGGGVVVGGGGVGGEGLGGGGGLGGRRPEFLAADEFCTDASTGGSLMGCGPERDFGNGGLLHRCKHLEAPLTFNPPSNSSPKKQA